MGKNLIQQKRGKGSSTFRAHGFNGIGDVKLMNNKTGGVIVDIQTSRFHSAPIAVVKYNDGEQGFLIAPEGIIVGQSITIGPSAELVPGNAMNLADIPDGAFVYNIEGQPGDGGKFARGSGVAARVLSRSGNLVSVMLPSKKIHKFNPLCRALLGTVAGGGRPEKPFVKAGNKFMEMKSKNRYWPKMTGAAMNAVSHPFGGKRTSRKGRPTIAPHNAPPGRKVGMIRPRKTGRARGTRVRSSGGSA